MDDLKVLQTLTIENFRLKEENEKLLKQVDNLQKRIDELLVLELKYEAFNETLETLRAQKAEYEKLIRETKSLINSMKTNN